ncbi:hypothetical protein TB2_015861 [Malus domestica]
MQPQHTRVKDNLGEFEDVALDESHDVTLVKESYRKIDEELVKEVQQQRTKVKESYRKIDDAALDESDDDPTTMRGLWRHVRRIQPLRWMRAMMILQL